MVESVSLACLLLLVAFGYTPILSHHFYDIWMNDKRYVLVKLLIEIRIQFPKNLQIFNIVKKKKQNCY